MNTWQAHSSKAAGAKTLWPEEQLGRRKLKRELEVGASHWCSPGSSGSQAGWPVLRGRECVGV